MESSSCGATFRCKAALGKWLPSGQQRLLSRRFAATRPAEGTVGEIFFELPIKFCKNGGLPMRCDRFALVFRGNPGSGHANVTDT